jgi:para-aminobenzoate synthetase/4-amino-4-deoxychorismate lyase
MRQKDYCRRIDRIRDYIAAGDSYQVNLTSKVRFDFSGSAAALYAQLRDRQRVSSTNGTFFRTLPSFSSASTMAASSPAR